MSAATNPPPPGAPITPDGQADVAAGAAQSSPPAEASEADPAAVQASRREPEAPPPDEPPPSASVSLGVGRAASRAASLLADLEAVGDELRRAGVETVTLHAEPVSDESSGGAPARKRAAVHIGEETDAVVQAVAALERLRRRAKVELAELQGHYRRHDVLVLALALMVMMLGGWLHRRMVTPPTRMFDDRGLAFAYAATWLPPQRLAPVPARLVRDSPTGATKRIYWGFEAALETQARMEVMIEPAPQWANIVSKLDFQRRARWGEAMAASASRVDVIASHDWLRTSYRYAAAPQKGAPPQLATAVEFATTDRENLYVVTFFGSAREVEAMEAVTASSLRVKSHSGLPLIPQASRLQSQVSRPSVARAQAATVMVIVADVVDGELVPQSAGAGVVVAADGSILTNYHVLHHRASRLHEVFVVARYAALDKAPHIWCAGRPSRSKLLPEQDLALIKCDTDLDGRAWQATESVWPAVGPTHTARLEQGTRLWVMGYPDVGGGGLMQSQGVVLGYTGEGGAPGTQYIKTDAAISHGNSGGPVLDDAGNLVGIASAFRTKLLANGQIVETSKLGLVRAIGAAEPLLTIARLGWTPREGATTVELDPTGVEAAAEGVRLTTRVLHSVTGLPVADARIYVLRPGLTTAQLDMNRLDEQVLAWGRANVDGEVRLRQMVPAPGIYSVLVMAEGYAMLRADMSLRLAADSPAEFDPWGGIGLRPE